MGMDVYGRNPSAECGQYFRATIWSWVPIRDLMASVCCEIVSEELLDAMAYNDGAGPDDPQVCHQIADLFELELEQRPEGFVVESELRVDEKGHFVHGREIGKHEVTYSPCITDADHVREWIAFLRHCGGFQVW